MIDKKILFLLACPECKDELIDDDDKLLCKKCNKIFPVKEGIPLFGLKDEEAFWKEFFNELSEIKGDSEEANAYFSKKSFEFTKSALLRAIGKPSGKNIVDIGCGTGHISSVFSKDNLIIGIDISYKILFHARRKGIFPIQSSATKLPLKSNSFDIIICNNLLQTILDGENVLEEISRVTSIGGRIYITTANKNGILNKIFSFLEREKYKRMRLYSMQEIVAYLSKKGIEATGIYYLSLPLLKVWNKKSDLIELISTSYLIEAEKR